MKRLVFVDGVYRNLLSALNADQRETCAILYAREVRDGEHTKLLVEEASLVPEHAYIVRSATRAQIAPEALIGPVQRAREAGESVVFAHSHPGVRANVGFSKEDDAGELLLKEFLDRRIPDQTHAALVVGEDCCCSRELGTHIPIEVFTVGTSVQVFCADTSDDPSGDRWDRQVRAFGKAGQKRLGQIRIGIVGLGGTGSLIAQQLAYLGVRDFLLIDPDRADETNLNRLVAATPTDVGMLKVQIAEAALRSIVPGCRVNSLAADVTEVSIARMLSHVDAIFSCTDSHASRAILNQVAYQYYVPMFDMGVGVVASEGTVSHITGRIQMASPGLPCLVCAGVIDAAAVRRELMTEVQRAADPYITGFREPQPAVISLNSTVASLAITMFLSAFTGIPGESRLQYYNGIAGTVRPATLRAEPSCIICSPAGALGQGDSWGLFGRVA